MYINDAENAHTGDYIVLQAGKVLIMGNRHDIVVMDKFDVVFEEGEGLVNGVNIIRESILLLQ
jgi:hypothetical protein